MDLVDPRIDAYAAAHTTPVRPELTALHEEAAGSLRGPAMLSGPVVGRLLQAFIVALQPRLVVEVGTYAGYAALAMAEALPEGGRLVTLELVDEHADFAERHFDASPLRDRIELRRGPALEQLRALDGPFDLVFVDAEKTGYPDYVEAALEKLAPNGLIICDNTLRDGMVLEDPPEDDGAQVLAALNDRLAADDRVVSVQLTVRDGLTIIRRA
jgi:caffeoyl-CoA O-methyltransferase